MVASDVQHLLFQHQGVSLCRFSCPADHRRWSRENQIDDGHNIAFPEVPVEIRHCGHPPSMADSTVAVFYNDGDLYQRRRLHATGDTANIFLFSAEHLLPAVSAFDPGVGPERPLSVRTGPVSAATFLEQRLLLQRVARDPAPDPNGVVERALGILGDVLADSYGAPPPEPLHRSRPRERVDAVRRLLAQRCDEPMSLRELAAAVDTSTYHLCRIFKRHTGQTLHAYRLDLRLREGLVRLEQGHRSLADLALEVGFSHQSHFTQAFRRAYGVPPGRLARSFT